MKKSSYIWIISILLLALLPFIWGCEKRTIAPAVSNPEESYNIEDYFPLSTGRSVVYVSTYSSYEPEIISREQFVVGDGIEEDNQRSYAWIHTNLDYSLISDTSFFYQIGNALFYYENADALPEKILEGPLEIGHSWERQVYPDPGDENNLFELLLENSFTKYVEPDVAVDYDKEGRPDDYESPVGKIFPVIGSSIMTIAAVEDLELENGLFFADCIKVQNQAGEYVNYYWYARGYGLVRYIIGATNETLTTASLPDGEIIGELNSAN